jgi:hypothetical protein
MKNRTDELLNKYWEGETSLLEEKELRRLLSEAQGYTKEKELFQALGHFRNLEPSQVSIPKKSKQRQMYRWTGWAASIAVLLGTYWGWTTYEQKQAEKEAYEEVMLALTLIQTNLAKGQEQMDPIKDLKYLNTTNQLFNLNPKN